MVRRWLRREFHSQLQMARLYGAWVTDVQVSDLMPDMGWMLERAASEFRERQEKAERELAEARKRYQESHG